MCSHYGPIVLKHNSLLPTEGKLDCTAMQTNKNKW